ncbi:uncharacterized protein TNCV_1864111 [Trichonephila clavipes]|nr:uncharacterized protein TNCV_1864111 [Trichonephila clavipes]
MTGTLPPLLDSVVGGGTPERSCFRALMDPMLLCPGGYPKSVKCLRSGDLLIETLTALQTKYFLLAKTFLNSPILISPLKSLNSCRGVISEPDLLTTPEAEIIDGFSDQGVIQGGGTDSENRLKKRQLTHQLTVRKGVWIRGSSTREAWNERGCVVRHTVGGWGEISKVVLRVYRFVAMVGDGGGGVEGLMERLIPEGV